MQPPPAPCPQLCSGDGNELYSMGLRRKTSMGSVGFMWSLRQGVGVQSALKPYLVPGGSPASPWKDSGEDLQWGLLQHLRAAGSPTAGFDCLGMGGTRVR